MRELWTEPKACGRPRAQGEVERQRESGGTDLVLLWEFCVIMESQLILQHWLSLVMDGAALTTVIACNPFTHPLTGSGSY